jgi:hypothetical protein
MFIKQHNWGMWALHYQPLAFTDNIKYGDIWYANWEFKFRNFYQQGELFVSTGSWVCEISIYSKRSKWVHNPLRAGNDDLEYFGCI